MSDDREPVPGYVRSEPSGRAEVACPNEECLATVSVSFSEDGAIELNASCNCCTEAFARSREDGFAYLAALEERARPVAEEMF